MAVVDAGEQNLKNISHPLRVYHIEPSVTSRAVARSLARAAKSRRLVSAAGAAPLAVILAVLTWFALLRDGPEIFRE